MTIRLRRATLLSFAFLASCGGGGSDEGGQVTTPAPAPVPTPSPAPSPTYDLAFDFSKTRTDQAQGVELLTYTRYIPSGVPNYHVFDHHVSNLHTDHETVEIKFSAENRDLSFGYLGKNVDFPGLTLETDTIDHKFYVDRSTYYDRHLRFTKPAAEINYINRGVETENDFLDPDNKSIERIFLYGSYTASSDIPLQGTASYAGPFITTSPTLDGAGGFFSNSLITINLSTGVIEGNIAIVPHGVV